MMTLSEYSKTVPEICFMTDMCGRIIRCGERERPRSVYAKKSVSGLSDITSLDGMTDGECRAVCIGGSYGAADSFVIRGGENAFWFITRATSGMLLPREKNERFASASSFAEAVTAARSEAGADELFKTAASGTAKQLFRDGMELPDVIAAASLCVRTLLGDDLLTLPDLIPKGVLIPDLDAAFSAVGKLLVYMCDGGKRTECAAEDNALVFLHNGEPVSEIYYKTAEPCAVYTVMPYIYGKTAAAIAVAGASALELSHEVRENLQKFDAHEERL